jgi:hypothetical protein
MVTFTSVFLMLSEKRPYASSRGQKEGKGFAGTLLHPPVLTSGLFAPVARLLFEKNQEKELPPLQYQG